MTDRTQPEALRDARWYMVDKDGMATLCTDREDAEQEAKDANMAWPHTAPYRAVQLVEVGTAAAELHRQHARIVELEAQLEAIGAGGVSGPLIGQAQAMPDLSALTERGAKAWAGVDAQGLREGVASAGSEPVAWVDERALSWLANSRSLSATITTKLEKGKSFERPMPLYLHPSPPEGMVGGWISVDERLPEWAARDDTPCFINGKEVPPTLTSETVLVALKGGGVRTDKLTTIEGKSDGWWHTYGERVVAWQKTPTTPAGSGKGE